MSKPLSVFISCLLAGVLLGGCGSKGTPNASSTAVPSPLPSVQASASGSSAPQASPKAASSPSKASEQPVAPETNPVGDISDTQAFVKYSSANGGYSVEVPEGWARTEKGTNVGFVNKLDGVTVTVDTAAEAPTANTIKSKQAADLEKNGRSVKIEKIQEIKTAGDKAVKVSYSSNSDPDSVTGKQVRLENEAYYYYKNSKLAVLTVWAPLGADNVDQWNKMSDSFSWTGK